MDHIDVLVDGASATYGSDAIGGVINIILKRNMDGAITQVRWTTARRRQEPLSRLGGLGPDLGRRPDHAELRVVQRIPDAGELPLASSARITRPWGFDDRRPLGSSLPATLSTGAAPAAIRAAAPMSAPSRNLGTAARTAMRSRSAPAQNWDPGASGIGPTAAACQRRRRSNWATFNVPPIPAPTACGTQFDPYDIAWYDARQERNGGAHHRRSAADQQHLVLRLGLLQQSPRPLSEPVELEPVGNNIITDVAVPTFNPYYPMGDAPSNLRAYYNIGWESPSITTFYELAQRYQLGLNIALPGDWSGRVWYAMTNDANFNTLSGTINKAAVSAALGWTITSTPPAGTTPAIATWTKPANVPYLNLFCDPTRLSRATRRPRSPTSRASETSTSATGSTKRACSSTARCSICRAARSRPPSARPTPASSCRPPCWTTPAPPA